MAGLRDAGAAQERPLIAKETVSRVLSESSKPDDVGVFRGCPPAVPGQAVPGSVVPVRREGLDVTVLSRTAGGSCTS
ncbi:hypothetical protein [Streptomyces sp. Ncost-T10-10d]|uniref:hypothetical protein n=1 Tax=Streptomyces sp. Ncost-T10-10d TaxID=1839774 RepID=UPI000B828FE6|nr:hypothetical protein [Streptomyces sp. Ncost-T10-10d]